MLPANGTAREDLDQSHIIGASFHPFRDEWWVLWASPPAVVTVRYGVVTESEIYLTDYETSSAWGRLTRREYRS